MLIKFLGRVARDEAPSCLDLVLLLSCIACFCSVSAGDVEIRMYFLANRIVSR